MSHPPCVDAWLDGELDEAGQAELLAWLAAKPAHQRDFIALIALQQQLSLPGQAPVRVVVRRARRRRSRGSWPLALAAAALVLVLVGGAWWWQTSAAPSVAVVVAGDLECAGQRLHSGLPVHADEVLTGTGRVRLADGSQVEVVRGRLRVADDAQGPRVHLEEGAVTVAAAHQSAGRRLHIITPQGTATVVGTSFTRECLGERTRLTVSTGTVRLHAAGTATATAIAVMAGESAEAMPGLVPEALPLVEGQPGLMWRPLLSALMAHEQAVARHDGAQLRSLAMPAAEQSPDFTPDQRLLLVGDHQDLQRSLFTLPQHSELRLRVRAQHPGTLLVTLHPTGPDGRLRHWSRNVGPIGPEWSDVVVSVSALGDESDSLPALDRDQPIHLLALYGFSTGELELAEVQVRRIPNPTRHP